MFKVVCISGMNIGDLFQSVPNKEITEAQNDDIVYEGKVYTVIDEYDFGYTTGYKLVGKDFRNIYLKNRFIPLSDIDETEFERNYNTEKIKL